MCVCVRAHACVCVCVCVCMSSTICLHSTSSNLSESVQFRLFELTSEFKGELKTIRVYKYVILDACKSWISKTMLDSFIRE